MKISLLFIGLVLYCFSQLFLIPQSLAYQLTLTPPPTIDAQEVELLFFKPTRPLTWVKWNPKTDQVAVADRDNSDVTIFKSIDGEVQYKLVNPQPSRVNPSVAQMVWSPDGNFLAISFYGNEIYIWQINTTSPQIIATIPNVDSLYEIVWTPNSQNLAFTNSGAPPDASPNISVWNVIDQKIIKTFSNEVFRPSWSPDGKQILILRYGNDAQILDAQTYTPLITIPKSQSVIASWSPDNRTIAGADCNATTSDCNFWFREASSTNLINQLNDENTSLGVELLVWRFDSSILATNSGRDSISLWEPNTGTLLAVLPLATGRAISLDWSRDGQLLVAVTAQGVAQAWKIRKTT